MYDDTAYREDAEDADAINWSHMYIMDINNDGKDEIFTKTPPGYRQPFEHSINGTIRILSSVRQQWRHGRTIITGWLICGLNISMERRLLLHCTRRFSPGRGIWWTPEYRRMAKPRF